MKAVTQRVAFDGTSGTAILIDKDTGHALANPKMYNEAQGVKALEAVKVGWRLLVVSYDFW